MDTEEERNGTLNGDDAVGQQEGSEGKRELTAAQKKREKLKMKKLLAQQQEGDDGKGSAEPVDGDSQEVGGEADGDKGTDDKKKKKKKKAVAKEEEKPKETSRKGPSKAQIAAIQEAIRKVKEDEERMLREEEEKDQQLNEAEDTRLEKLRLEQERKERKKQKEKEKKERLKAEGKWLTPKQKLEQQKAHAFIEQLKAQGVEVPEAGTEKKPRPGTRVRPKKLQSQASQERMENETNGSETNAEAIKKSQTEAEALAEIEAVKEAWDQESEEEETETKTAEEPEAATDEKKSSDEDDSDGTDEDESEGSDEDDDEGSDSDSIVASEGDSKRKEKETAQIRIQKRRDENEKGRTLKNLRAPVVCVLGHVDTGKTKILDKLRRTHVQDNEAGGITQQIGATNVPIAAIKESAKFVKNFAEKELKIPGLLIIDTPGHESFSNLRSRGSSLCDIAILVVDIMHGLEPQTIESLNLLKIKKTPFVVALNKIDRLYEWQSSPKRDISDVIKLQPKNTSAEFEKRKQEVILQFAEQGLNAALFDENPDIKTYISMIPTSAFTGDGMGNLMALIVDLSQSMLAKRLMYSKELQATVLEVKAIPGLGTTIDIILINGFLRVGETLILAGTDGPITTQIRSLLTPDGMKELRVKNTYVEHKEISGAIGVKIAAKDLEKAIAGLNVQVAFHPDEIDVCREEVAREFKSALNSIRLSERGVYVQASTLGSLEALLEFLKTSQIPYSGIRIGPVVKKDVMKASIMLEHDSQYAVILAFDVKIERDAQDLADNLGVRIFQADIIYHLFDKFMAYRDELKAKKRDEFKHVAVFPCKLKILPQFIFNSRDPIVVGVIVEAGIVKEGTPMCVPNREFLEIGRVTSIEINHKQVNTATKGQEVCIKIEPTPGDSPKMLGRHFEETDMLVSKITRESIDACKDYFRNDLQKSDWQLMVELKKLFQIM